jgi:putative transcriptional regulator
MQSSNLTNQFLIAMPRLEDPNFFKTVTYICSHNEEGAMGIVINRPIDMKLSEIFSQMDIPVSYDDIESQRIYHGGPVQEDRGFVLHKTDEKWDSSFHVANGINVTTSMDIIKSIANGNGPDERLLALGYAGWAAGQLEKEIKENVWLNVPSNPEIIFNTPFEKRLESSASLIGIDLCNISSDIGHA